MTPDAARGLHPRDGSWGPKVVAAARFAEATGRRAMIGGLAEAAQLLAGDAGTTIAPAGAPVRTEAT
jgi:carbamate kinase